MKIFKRKDKENKKEKKGKDKIADNKPKIDSELNKGKVSKFTV